MSSWTVKAKKIAAGKWIRFDAANPQHTLTFVGEPEEVTKTSQQGPTKGETYKQMSFPVLLDGEEKILEPNKSLLTQLIEEDEEEPIIGAELLIKCLNPEKKTQWKIRRIAKGKDQITAYESKKEPEIEPEDEELEEIAQDSQESKDKEKFMEGVKKTKAKREKKEKEPSEEEA
jgi:hypothetical protein